MRTFPADCYNPGLSRIKAWDEALTSIAGVPESQLSRNVAAGLADSAPGPPWDCRVSGVFWSHKAKPGAAEEALPEVLRASRVIGALIRYIDSPRPEEIIAVPSALPPGPCRSSQSTVKPSQEVGRTGPKVLARFGTTVACGRRSRNRPRLDRARRHDRPLRLPTWLLLVLPVVARVRVAPLPGQGAGWVALGDGRRRGQLGGHARPAETIGTLHRLALPPQPCGGPTLTAKR